MEMYIDKAVLIVNGSECSLSITYPGSKIKAEISITKEQAREIYLKNPWTEFSILSQGLPETLFSKSEAEAIYKRFDKIVLLRRR